jgi:hypothetical protein
MSRHSFLLLPLLLTACGADVASTAATTAALKATEAKQAQKTKENVQKKLDAATQAAEERQQAADQAPGYQ